MKRRLSHQAGFSLIELTIVLVIVAILSGGLMFGLTAQSDTTNARESQRQLEVAKDALLGFAMSKGRLPCPADLKTPPVCPSAPTLVCSGLEGAFKADGKCTSQYGVLPWLTLGLSETDPWGNHFTYFVSEQFSAKVPDGAQASFTLDSGVKNPDGTSNTAGLADIYNLTETNGVPGVKIAIDIAAVIVSHGKRSAGAYLSDGTKLIAIGDEFKNSNGTQSFVSSTPTPDFDDQLVWISQHILKSRLVAVGKLP